MLQLLAQRILLFSLLLLVHSSNNSWECSNNNRYNKINLIRFNNNCNWSNKWRQIFSRNWEIQLMILIIRNHQGKETKTTDRSSHRMKQWSIIASQEVLKASHCHLRQTIILHNFSHLIMVSNNKRRLH